MANASRPFAVAVGYFNNDSWLDIAVANSDTNEIGIFLGYGNRSFSLLRTYSTGSTSRPISLAVGDVNHDYLTDIVVANYDSHSVGVLIGDGNGSFASPDEYFLGRSRPVSIGLSDLNNDTWLDIVIASNSTQSIIILFGAQNGIFTTNETYSTGYDSAPCSIAIDDFNNDERLDVAVANYGTNNIGIFFGHKNKTLTMQTTLSTGIRSAPCSISTADLNNDNQSDIIVANYNADNIDVFIGYGNGSFEMRTPYFLGSGSNPCSVATGYLDSNDQLDIVVSNAGTHSLSILIGYGNGSFATPTTHTFIVGSIPIGLGVGDFDNDNQSDVVVTHFGTNSIAILSDYRAISSENPSTYSAGNGSLPYALALSNFNNDTYLDIAVASYGADSISILFGYGNGTFGEQMSFHTGNGSRPSQVAIGDLNNDQFSDIVIANLNADYMSVLLGYGNGSFLLMKPYFYEQILTITWVDVGDFNGDHQLDIVQANFGGDSIMIYLGYGNGSFKYEGSYLLGDGSRPMSVVVNDFNNDTYLDFATANYGTSNVAIFLGYGNGSFTMQTKYPTGEGSLPQYIVIGDINNDNCLDIAVGNNGGNNIGVFIGYCNGSFTSQIVLSTGPNSYPYSVVMHGMNNDQQMDLIVAYDGFNSIGILLGYGNGSFATPLTFPSGLNSDPYHALVGDLNNDNRMDVVTANHGTNNVAVLLGHTNVETSRNNVFILGDFYFDFENEIIYSTGSSSRPYSIAVGDFNNDAQLDIVIANSGTENISILLGYGNGQFHNETTYWLGSNSRPQYIIVNDFNKDNRLDIAVSDYLSGTVNLFLGHGNGSFADQLIIPTDSGSNPSSIAMGDFNNDQWLDLVVTNMGTNTIDLMFGYQYGSFQRSIISLTSTNVGFSSVAIADFNNDGQLDIVTSNYNINNVGVYLGYGNGSFTSPVMYGNVDDSHPWFTIVGDFNTDSKADIAIAAWGVNQIGIILGNGDGTFGEPLLYSTGIATRPVAMVTHDFNNDKHLDIATANYGTGSVSVFLGFGDGTFTNASLFSTGDGSGSSSITVIDLDNDNYLDIIVANEVTYNVGVLYGNGDGTFPNLITYLAPPDSSPQYALSADFNNDGLLDLAVALYGVGGIGVFLGLGNRTFTTINVYPSGSDTGPQYLSCSDFNDDTYRDIVVGNKNDGSVGILFGNGDGTFRDIFSYYKNPEAVIFAVAIGDFNNDKRSDIVFVDNNQNTVGVLLRNGFMPFGGHTSLSYVAESNPSSVAVGHFNNDTILDIAIANSGTNNVGILLGYGDGTFENVQMYSTGNDSQPLSIALADFNNDGFVDIIVANSNTDNIGIYFGSYTGIFENFTTYSTGSGSNPVSVIVVDFNHDLVLDIIVANFGRNSLGIFIGDGYGSFADQIVYPIGYNYHPNSIAFGNFNNDSWIDIGVANYGTSSVSILLNCPPL